MKKAPKIKEKKITVLDPSDPNAQKEIEKILRPWMKDISKEEQKELLSINVRREIFEISKHLETYHAFFYKLWDMGIPRLTFSIPTAAVGFDRKGNHVEFLFNPKFWKESSLYKKLFVICHESLHVLLNHGIRQKDCKVKQLANIAMDVAINHMLCDRFGFDRTKVEGWEQLCWLDTTFKEIDGVEKNQIFEYYYGILEQNCKIVESKIFIVCHGSGGCGNSLPGETLDDHGQLGDFNSRKVQKELQDAIDKGLSEEDKEDLARKVSNTNEGKKASEQEADDKESTDKQAGTCAGNLVQYANIHKRVVKKKKWETVIQKWSRKFKTEDRDAEQWARLNRRLQFFKNHELMLPSEYEEDNKNENMIDVFFFLDTSGSCVGLKDRFFDAARSLSEDRFNLHLHCFDTKVYEVDIKEGKLYGFGGTSFTIIEQYIQDKIKMGKIKKFPTVFIITDGYGDNLTTENPKNYYWFLSENYRSCIPKECNIFMLSDFE